jgi:hypothetical protein
MNNIVRAHRRRRHDLDLAVEDNTARDLQPGEGQTDTESLVGLALSQMDFQDRIVENLLF